MSQSLLPPPQLWQPVTGERSVDVETAEAYGGEGEADG